MIQKGETDPSSALLLRELCGYGRRSEGYSCTCQERSSTVVHMGIWENHLEIENIQRYSVNTLLPVRHREPGTWKDLPSFCDIVFVAIKKTWLTSLGLYGPSLKRQQTMSKQKPTNPWIMPVGERISMKKFRVHFSNVAQYQAGKATVE